MTNDAKSYADNYKAAISDLLFNLIRRAQKVTIDGRLEFSSDIDEIADWIAKAYSKGFSEAQKGDLESCIRLMRRVADDEY